MDPDEFHCSVQIVRTLDSMFKPSTGGETGVLESYLRAIHFAKRFIYIENQYFNNDAITEALIEALARNVEVILLLNPAPDMPLYLGWQQKAIRRTAKSLSDNGINPDDRLGVFSAWTHASAQSTGSSKPTLVDNYLHTKSALIDNVWASVGSANLDGASLDSQQYMRQFIGDDLRNTEANVVVYEENATIVPAVDALRRRLWSEHLGFSNAADTALDDAPTKKWVPVWRQLARAKRDALKQDLNNVVAARVLEWPTDSYEKALGICRMFKMFKSHATATAYLRSLLSPKEVPSDVVAEKGPGSYTFTYGAFPDTSVPGSRLASAESAAAISGSAAISDEAATT